IVGEPAVLQCYRVSPGPDFILVLQLADMPAYHALAHQVFTAKKNVRNVRTFFSTHRAQVETRPALPPRKTPSNASPSSSFRTPGPYVVEPETAVAVAAAAPAAAPAPAVAPARAGFIPPRAGAAGREAGAAGAAGADAPEPEPVGRDAPLPRAAVGRWLRRSPSSMVAGGTEITPLGPCCSERPDSRRNTRTSSTRRWACSLRLADAAALCSTSAAFCWVTSLSCSTASFTCEMPEVCSDVAALISLMRSVTCFTSATMPSMVSPAVSTSLLPSSIF